MPSSHPSVTVRALKAKLQVLRRPAVWGSAAVLGVAGFFLVEYLSNPQRFIGAGVDVALPESTVYRRNPLWNFSQNEYGGGFGNLPWANADPIQQNRLQQNRLQQNRRNGASARADSSRVALDGSAQSDLNRDRRAQRDGQLNSQPGGFSFGNADQTLMGAGVSPVLTQGGVLTNPRSMGSPATAPSPSAANNSITSPLQSALNRIASGNQPNPRSSMNQGNDRRDRSSNAANSSNAASRSSSSFSTNFGTNFGMAPAETASDLPPREAFPGQAFPTRYEPRTSPPVGSTGYTMPPALRSTVTPNPTASPDLSTTYSTAYPDSFTNPVSPQPIPGGYRTTERVSPMSAQPGTFRQPTFGPAAVGSPARSTVTAPAPFSVPRPVPGRSIGNGEVNTFSNP